MDGAGIITISQVIDHIDSGMPFDMVHVTADSTRGTGGQIKKRKSWIKCQWDIIPEVILRRNKVFDKLNKDPDYGRKKSRLILNPATQEIRLVHLRLICIFNGKYVK